MKPPSKKQYVVVETINLSFNALNFTSVDLISNTVLICKVKHLYIHNNNIKSDGVEKFRKFLINNRKSVDMQVLRMENNYVEYPTAETFANEIQNSFYKRPFWLCMDHILLIKEYKYMEVTHHSFKCLYIFNCNINVISCFEHTFRNLEKVSICNNRTRDSEVTAEELIKKLQGQNSNVSVAVMLQQVLIAIKADNNLLHHLLQQTLSVKVMRFKYCKISNEILLQIKQTTKKLYELSFQACYLGKEGCENLLQLLPVVGSDSEVISLNLSANQIESYNDIKSIVDVCNHLKVCNLCLTDNNLDDNKIKYFAELLQNKEHVINTIDFRNNHTCTITEGEFLHISKCQLHVYITAKTEIYYEDHLKQSNCSDGGNIEYLYFIKYAFTTEMFKNFQLYNYLKKLHLVGQLNMNSKEFVRILQGIHTHELLVVSSNFTNDQADVLFKSVSCSIVIAADDTILGKNCANGELINTALMYSISPYFKQIHFTNCDITEHIEEITSQLLKFHKTEWRSLKIEQCRIDDNSCTSLVHILCKANVHIKSISFSGNLLTSSSVEPISSIINNLNVSMLCLNNNKYSLEDVDHIFNVIMITYNIEELSFEQNEIDELSLNNMVKNKFLSFEFDKISRFQGSS